MFLKIILNAVLILVGMMFGAFLSERMYLDKARKLLKSAANNDQVDVWMMVGTCVALEVLFDQRFSAESNWVLWKKMVNEQRRREK